MCSQGLPQDPITPGSAAARPAASGGGGEWPRDLAPAMSCARPAGGCSRPRGHHPRRRGDSSPAPPDWGARRTACGKSQAPGPGRSPTLSPGLVGSELLTRETVPGFGSHATLCDRLRHPLPQHTPHLPPAAARLFPSRSLESSRLHPRNIDEGTALTALPAGRLSPLVRTVDSGSRRSSPPGGEGSR